MEDDPREWRRKGSDLVLQASALTDKGAPEEEIQALLSLAATYYLRAGEARIAVACLMGSVLNPRAQVRTVGKDHHDWIE